MREAFICDAVRTPVGRYGGALAQVRADDLAAEPLKALMARNPGVDWSAVDDLIYGCANQAGEDNRNVGRMAVLLAGMPVGVPGTTVNRLCGSGMDAVGMAARAIKAGDCDFVIAGGVESMTRAPFVMPKAETPFARGPEIFDTTIGWRFIHPRMAQTWGTDSMPETAENLAAEHGISRLDQDRYALLSQSRYDAEWHAADILPIAIQGRKADSIVSADEHPRPTTLERLAALPTPFRTPGTVTAGNASGVNDGAAAVLLASSAAVRRYGLCPLARIGAAASGAVEPRVMGIGPVTAARRLTDRTGRAAQDHQIIELNEAFAAQVLACTRAWGLTDDDPRLNACGGAIAMGHPLGMSGARLAGTAARRLAETGARSALVSLCVGVGQGVALELLPA